MDGTLISWSVLRSHGNPFLRTSVVELFLFREQPNSSKVSHTKRKKESTVTVRGRRDDGGSHRSRKRCGGKGGRMGLVGVVGWEAFRGSCPEDTGP